MSDDFVADTVKILGPKYNKKGQGPGFVIEFSGIIERKRNDFLWTAKEMNNLWLMLDKYNRTDVLQEIAEIVLFEKLLLFMLQKKYLGDRKIWRDIFEHGNDEVYQGQIIGDLAKARGANYFMACTTRSHVYLNAFYFAQLSEVNEELKPVFEAAFKVVSKRSLVILNA